MHLKSYILLSSSFLALHDSVSGQLWYRDYEPDSLLLGPYTEELYIDLNHDGIDDFKISAFESVDSDGFTESVKVRPLNGAQLASTFLTGVGYWGDDFYMVKEFSIGDTVPGTIDFTAFTRNICRKKVSFGYSSSDVLVSAFANGYIGVMVPIDSMPHYGWIRCERPGGYSSILVYDHALNSQAGLPTVVGDLSGGLIPTGASDVVAKVVSFPGSADHIRVQFDVPADESAILEYRIFLTEEISGSSHTRDFLTTVPSSSYVSLSPTGGSQLIHFPFAKKTIQGNDLATLTKYRAIVGTVLTASPSDLSFVSQPNSIVELIELDSIFTPTEEEDTGGVLESDL